MTYDSTNNIITLSFVDARQLYKFEGENALQFRLQDRGGAATTYNTGVVIRIYKKNQIIKKPVKPVLNDGKYVSALIRRITFFGEMTIKFSHKMRVLNPNITLTDINDTFIDAYIVP